MADEEIKLDYQSKPVKLPPASDGLRVINTDPEYYRQLMLQEKSSADGMEIGGESTGGRLWRLLGWIILVILVAAAFTFLFYHFTNNLRVALVVVGAMLAYMLASAYLAEGSLDQRNRD